jgi:hypothetical protein
VARGAGIVVENLDKYSRVLASLDRVGGNHRG